MKPARTRFAVSPTGFMHIGGTRAGLFDWLVARQTDGQFILRIEDTDQAREVPGAVEHIIKSLHWLGLQWDEGPDIGGPHAPYTQSERLDIYKQWAQRLVTSGRAYADPYTAEELERFREAAKTARKPFLFRDHRPKDPPTWDGTQGLRFKSEPRAYTWHDEIMGDLHAGPEAVDDFILMKADGLPTYNFCHIIDDEIMGITHVIRGQEFIASMPRYLNLYDALGIKWPIFAHAPWIMRPDGKKKLSKRDGAKDVMSYAEQGFLPDALLNFLASLGWNDGSEQDIFSRDELVAKFRLDRVQKSGARFDEQRLAWMDGVFIRGVTLDGLFEKAKDFWPAEAKDTDDDYKKRVLALVQERLKFLAELPELTTFFFTDLPINPPLWQNNKQLRKLTNEELKDLLTTSKSELKQSDFSVDDLTKRLNTLIAQTGQKPGVLFSLIRIATTQSPASPGLADTLAVLGKDTSLRRIEATLQAL